MRIVFFDFLLAVPVHFDPEVEPGFSKALADRRGQPFELDVIQVGVSLALAFEQLLGDTQECPGNDVHLADTPRRQALSDLEDQPALRLFIESSGALALLPLFARALPGLIVFLAFLVLTRVGPVDALPLVRFFLIFALLGLFLHLRTPVFNSTEGAH